MRKSLIAITTVALLAACTTPPHTLPGTPVKNPGTPRAQTTNLGAVNIRLLEVASGLNSPVAIAFRLHDPHTYVAEQDGHVRAILNGHIVATSLTLSVAGGNEQGLLGLAFSPTGSKMYVDYTIPNGDIRVDEYTMFGTAAINQRHLLLQPHHIYANHNGGNIVVDSKGYLYIGLGDGGGQTGDPLGSGQNTNTLLGKILRIDPHANGALPYSIPAGNPFKGQVGKKGSIWMYGLRNPWRFSLDRHTGDMWIGDVGQNLYEEIDYATAGKSGQNWGWNVREGFHPFAGGSAPNARNPIREEPHTNGWCAIIGGDVYRGSAIPNLNGVYLYTDNCRDQIVALTHSGKTVTGRREFNFGIGSWTTFGENGLRELYVASRNGSIYRIVRG